MNIEQTMQFILEAQARAEVRAEKQDLRTLAMEKRLDKRMGAITKLLHQGMRMLVRTEARLEEVAATQKELAIAQKETDRSLKRLIDGLIRGRNGQ